MDRYYFEFKEETSLNHDVYVQSRPNVPGKKQKVSYLEIGGRDETVSLQDELYENVEIALDCAYRIDSMDWNKKRREIGQWLSGTGELKLSDDPEVYWKVKNIQISKFERPLKKYAEFEVKFVCSPFEYVVEGKEWKTIKEALFNPYDLSHPEYRITGEGVCTLTVNGKAMKANIGQNLIIDTDAMLAYRQDGAMMNTSVTGDYEELYLKPGENSIAVSPGFSISIKPNWRCI